MDARRLEGEWLDELPADDPRARRSRADLRRINAIMGNARIVAKEMVPGTSSVAEVGAGDGAFALRLAKMLRPRPGIVTLVDQQRIVPPETLRGFEGAGVKVTVEQADVFDWLQRDGTPLDAIVANLFLHHFEDEPLRRMLGLIARRTRFFVACETRRSATAVAGARMLRAIGANDVTMHDALVSVRAGFRDGDLTRLWPAESGWKVSEKRRGLFSHLFVAGRTGP